MSRKYKTGDVIGTYTVIDYCENRNDKLKCKCNKCGSIVEVFTCNIVRQRMCRYCRTENNRKPRKNLSNKRFGRLTALEYVSNSDINGWLCKCDCGETTIVKTNRLISGHTKSCGCYMRDRTSESNFKDLSGMKFNRLTAMRRIQDYITPSGNPLTQYECRCDCGNYLNVLAMNLVSGNSQSCGCIGRSRGEAFIKDYLESHSIEYKPQYSFDDLRSELGFRLKFDFGIINNSNLYCLIEYHGEQHFYTDDRERHFFGKLQRDVTDKQKEEYCRSNKIKLYIIRFDDDIKSKMDEIINDLRAV